jgi:hypothetical protein
MTMVAQELIKAVQFGIKTSATELKREPRQQRIARQIRRSHWICWYFLFASFSFVPQKKKKTVLTTDCFGQARAMTQCFNANLVEGRDQCKS